MDTGLRPAGQPQAGGGRAGRRNKVAEDPLQTELEKLVLGLVTAQPGITLSRCIDACSGVFGSGEVKAAVNTLAKASRIRLEGTIHPLEQGVVVVVRLHPVP